MLHLIIITKTKYLCNTKLEKLIEKHFKKPHGEALQATQYDVHRKSKVHRNTVLKLAQTI